MNQTPGEASMSEFGALQLQLTDLRRAFEVGNAQTQGSLALLVERSDQAKVALDEHRAWVKEELRRNERAVEAEETARTKGDDELRSLLDSLRTKSAMTVGVGMTLSVLGGTLLGHFWPR